MSQNPYQASNFDFPTSSAAMAAADARATFIKRTYLHLLGALLAFVAIDAVILTLFSEQLDAIVPRLLGGWTWLIVLGGFMLVSYIADRWAHSNTSRQMQYVGLSVYIGWCTVVTDERIPQ